MKKYLYKLLICVLICCFLVGCEKKGNANDDINTQTSQSNDSNVAVDFTQTDEDMFTDRDYQSTYDENQAVKIQLNGDSATSSSSSVKINGGTITIKEEATYVFSGSLTNGMIVVNAKDNAKLHIVLNGVDITSKTSAPLYIKEADKVFVTLVEGKTNKLSNEGSFKQIDDNNIDGVIFSKQDLTFNGTGSLTINSPSAHGIVCKDDLVLTGGVFNINSAYHGINANDSVRITNQTNLTLQTGKDGIHCENNDDQSLGFIYISDCIMSAETQGDGIDAGAYLHIKGGTFELLTGGGYENGSQKSSSHYGNFMGRNPHDKIKQEYNEDLTEVSDESSSSMKGIKSTNSLLISGGCFNIDSADDAIHSNVNATIKNGTFDIASGDDAIHADEDIVMEEGQWNIQKSYEGIEAVNININGGEYKIYASDDGINAAGGVDSSGLTGGRDGMFDKGKHGMTSGNGSIVISGGNLYVNASGDGIDANGTLTISGGYTVVVGPTNGDTATLDYDKSATITGGTFIGTGASNMAQTFSETKQGVIAVDAGIQDAGTKITLKDKNNKTIMTYTPELSFSVVIISQSDIVSGELYTIVVGSQSGQFEAY